MTSYFQRGSHDVIYGGRRADAAANSPLAAAYAVHKVIILSIVHSYLLC